MYDLQSNDCFQIILVEINITDSVQPMGFLIKTNICTVYGWEYNYMCTFMRK